MLVLAVALVVIVFLQPLVSYATDGNKLRQFPSPSFAGLSSLWRIYKNLQYKHYLAIHEAHKILGTHVRIAPNHLSISDPQALQDIYGHGANFLKDAWYDGGAGEYRHMADARVKAEHQAKRKLLAHVFAPKTIANLEPVISATVARLLAQIEKAADSTSSINMRRYLNYFTIDVFSSILYGNSLGCLQRGNDMVDAETKDGKVYTIPFIKSLHDAVHINTVLGMEAPLLPLTKRLFSFHSHKKAGADYDNIIYHNTVRRLQAANTDCASTSDVFSKLLTNNKGEPLGLCLGELLAEGSVMMNAGTDTTAAALTNTIYLLYKHPYVLTKLRQELDEATDNTTIPSYDSLSHLPYLRACVEESLRLRPPSSMGLPRVVPPGGRTIAGKFIEEGTTVSVPTYTLLRDPVAFENPDEYNPDRWINGDKEMMARAHFPFSTGPRACIGRNISYFEQLVVIAAVVKGWDFEFVEGGFELETIERFNSNPGEMVMWVRRREGA